jgi:hypothetical protein
VKHVSFLVSTSAGRIAGTVRDRRCAAAHVGAISVQRTVDAR